MFARTLVAALLLALCAGANARSQSGAARAIDPSKSTAQFSVSHIWVERVVGTVPIVSGSVTAAPNSSVPAAATAVLDPTRLKTDEPDRDDALRSPDFFDVKTYPTWTFTSTRVIPQGNNAFLLDGNLTIHGVTQPERLDVTVSGDAAHPIYHAVGHVDRHAFGMRRTRLDPTIGQVVDVTLDVALQ
jgi:polyisoprenoid-binding protein YceI